MSLRNNGKHKDDFSIDTSGHTIDDLDKAKVQILGGALDGSVVEFGIGIVPEEITAKYRTPGQSEIEIQRYELRTAEGESDHEAYFQLDSLKRQ